MIDAGIDCLSERVFYLAKEIQQQKDDCKIDANEHLRLVFALAAFAQFHFVDIYPFSDGNGRICRLISKLILDSILPVPFPMFISRENYIESLNSARQVGVEPRTAPAALSEILLDSAIEFYDVLGSQIAAMSQFDFLFCGRSIAKIKEQLDGQKQIFSAETQTLLLTEINSLNNSNDCKNINTPQGIVRIRLFLPILNDMPLLQPAKQTSDNLGEESEFKLDDI